MANVHFDENALQGEKSEKFLSEEDLSDYKQYKTSRRRQMIFKLVLFLVVIVLLVTTIVYFTKIHPKERKEKLNACTGGQDEFESLPGKCFVNRIGLTDESVSFFDSLESCMSKCLSWPTCYSLDFFSANGECYTYSILSSEAPDEFVDTRDARHGVQPVNDRNLEYCVHYDRACL